MQGHEAGSAFERRVFLRTLGTVSGLAAAGCAAGTKVQRPTANGGEAKVTPAEDLMQEHGVLERILLVYEASARRIDLGDPFNFATLTAAAGMVRRFVQDYHEKNEEQLVFPRLNSAGRETELVATLLTQHRRGREVTDAILQSAGRGGSPDLIKQLRAFSRMYRPHAAREDTVVFPAFRALMGPAYGELGEQLEEQEHRILGEHGFENAVAEVARLEDALGIADLGRLTP